MSANEGSISIEGLSGIFLGNGASITANSAALTGTACPTSGLACGTISPLPPPPIVVISNPGGDISLVGQQGGSISVNPGATGTVSIGQGGGSLVLTNSGSLTLVAGSGAITTTTVQGPLTLQSINLLSQLPAGQAASRGNAQIMGSMSTISRVNDFTRGLGSAAPQTLAPPRTALTFE